MTDHRQPPPIAGSEGLGPSVAPPAKVPLALPTPHLAIAGRLGLDRRRVAIALGVIVLGVVGYHAAQAFRGWLGAQPAYQVSFRAIVLEPPPPVWYRGGTLRFLDDVRRETRIPDTVPILELKRDDLEKVFVRSPWTEKVLKVVYPPLGVTVHLAYRRPVALVETWRGENYLVDGSAVILPQDDLDTDVASFVKEQGLIRIKGDGLLPPLDPRPGLTWKTMAGVTDLAPGNDRIPGAARLARFLVDKMRTIDKARSPCLDIHYINPMDREGRGLFLQNAEDTYVLWGEESSEQSQGVIEAEEKWVRLEEWTRVGMTRALRPGDYWKITREGVVYQRAPTPLAARHRARAIRDDSAVRTNRSGQ